MKYPKAPREPNHKSVITTVSYSIELELERAKHNISPSAAIKRGLRSMIDEKEGRTVMPRHHEEKIADMATQLERLSQEYGHLEQLNTELHQTIAQLHARLRA